MTSTDHHRQDGRDQRTVRRRRRLSLAAIGGSGAVVLASLSGAGGAGGPAPLATTSDDFFQAGTQPQMNVADFAPITVSNQCQSCHGNYDFDVEPFAQWSSSMLAQSARDPIFWAAVTIANQDAVGAGEFCIRCHAPNAFLDGLAPEADNVNFTAAHDEGVNCMFCHRMVNPVPDAPDSPSEDEVILADLLAAGLIPAEGSNARFVLDPIDTRRGPFDDLPFNPHPGSDVIVSPFHEQAEFCWTCHDVSNPLMERTADGSYTLGPLGQAHGTGSQLGQFPLHRTYSEWKNSYYFTTGVQHNGRFGGNHPTGVMNSCQDCHMPDQAGFGCLVPGFPERPNVPQHSFLGANTWVLEAVNALFPQSETGLTDQSVADGIARNENMLALASDLVLQQDGPTLKSRLINRSGHKLPTGFPDGRRVWFNVRFLDAAENVVEERGAYDFAAGVLVGGGDDTTVIEAHFGVSEDLAADLGVPPGKTFHFALANEIVKDNRIPPAGWSVAIAEQQQMAPVGATFANGQHWMDLEWTIPPGATQVIVTTYYQTTSREFIEFLRDANVTDGRGQLAYDLWEQFGRGRPAVMDMVQLDLSPTPDLDGSGTVDFADLVQLLSLWGACPTPPEGCSGDLNGDGAVGFDDVLILLGAFD